MIYSGVSLQQLFFVMKNAPQHDFSVSICSLFNDKSYVVQTSLGEILDSTKPRRKHIIPLFRISVHDEHSCHVKSAHGLDYLLENNLYNRNFSKEWKQRALEDSESSEEALQRARLQVVFGKTPKYKLERKKDFKQAYFSKQKSELNTLKINYFWIKNVDGCLMHRRRHHLMRRRRLMHRRYLMRRHDRRHRIVACRYRTGTNL